MISGLANCIHWVLDTFINVSLNIILWMVVFYFTIILIEKANKTIKELNK